jgi:hypothetical protein
VHWFSKVFAVYPSPSRNKNDPEKNLDEKYILRILPVSQDIKDEAGADESECETPDYSKEAFPPAGSDARGI